MPDSHATIRPDWLLNGDPFDVQRAADDRAGFQRGFLWWLEQGLGKSAVALQNWQRWKHQRTGGHRARRLIIITLNSMRLTWAEEIRKWVKEPLDIEVSPEPHHADPDVFIVNYEAFAGQGTGWGKGFDRAWDLATRAPTMLVVDECHRIKTPGSRWSKSVLELARECIARRGLTGTPWGQSVMDLYPQFKLAGELEGLNQFVFKNRFAKKGGYMGKQVVGVNETARPQLDRIMDACSMRALKSDWTDLPPKMPAITIPLELPRALVPHYRSMLADFIVELDTRDPDDPITAKMVVTQMGKLQQISSGFIYDEAKQRHELMPVDRLPKYQALLDLIDGLGGASKMLVFCHYRSSANALMAGLGKLPGGCAGLLGGMTPEQIEHNKAQFNQDGGPMVMVAQISVGAAGHTLLGGDNLPCYTTAFFENSYVLIDREQSADRNHRFGQRHPVSYYDFASTEIERHVIRALQTKRSLAHAVIDSRRPIQQEFGIVVA